MKRKITPRKRFGQHFLRDPHILHKIAQTIHPTAKQHIVEIGPGEGVLTELILPHTEKMDAIEIDRDLIQVLEQRFAHYPQLRIHQHDVLKFNWSTLTTTPHSLRIIGNLPYNISSPLLFKLFLSLELIQDMYFMLQKEVVIRMTAAVNTTHYNRLSVMTQYFCTNQPLFDIPPSAFFPPPKVDSTLIHMVPHPPALAAKDMTLFADVVRTAFNQRRKMIHNSFKKILAPADYLSLNINDHCRPQELSVTDFVKISNFLYDNGNKEFRHEI